MAPLSSTLMPKPTPAAISTMLLRARDDGEKPTSTFLKSGVPAIIVGVVVFVALAVCGYFLYRNRRRDAQEAKSARMWNDMHS